MTRVWWYGNEISDYHSVMVVLVYYMQNSIPDNLHISQFEFRTNFVKIQMVYSIAANWIPTYLPSPAH